MMDTVAGAFGALKGAAEITQALLALKTDAAVTTKAIELNRIICDVQQQLLTTQADYSAILRKVDNLESEVADLKRWEQEKERYGLHELAPGTLVYRVKPAMQGGEPVHDLCPNCYQQGIKSILQNNGVQGWHETKICPRPNCKATFLAKRIECSGVTIQEEDFPGRQRGLW